MSSRQEFIDNTSREVQLKFEPEYITHAGAIYCGRGLNLEFSIWTKDDVQLKTRVGDFVSVSLRADDFDFSFDKYSADSKIPIINHIIHDIWAQLATDFGNSTFIMRPEKYPELPPQRDYFRHRIECSNPSFMFQTTGRHGNHLVHKDSFIG